MADLRCHGRIAAHPGCCGPASGHPAAHAAAEATAGAARRRPADTSMIKVRPGKLTFPNVRTTRLASGIRRSRCGCRRWAPPRGAARAAGCRAATAGPARGRPRSARAASWPARSARGRPCVTGPRPARLIVGLALEAASTRPLTDVPHCRRAPLERRALRRTGASSCQSRFGWDTRAFHTGEAVTVLSMADHGGLAMLASRTPGGCQRPARTPLPAAAPAIPDSSLRDLVQPQPDRAARYRRAAASRSAACWPRRCQHQLLARETYRNGSSVPPYAARSRLAMERIVGRAAFGFSAGIAHHSVPLWELRNASERELVSELQSKGSIFFARISELLPENRRGYDDALAHLMSYQR